MSLLGPTLVLYLLIGLGVAVALYLSDAPRPSGERWLRLSTALPFWPIYLPILLAQPASAVAAEDEWTRSLAEAESELKTAVDAVRDWITLSEDQRHRLDKLRDAWQAQAERLRQMDRLLARPEYAVVEENTERSATPRVRQSLAARQQNLERLRSVRRQVEADLLASLAWVRELASRIPLARFTDAPPTQVEELLNEIAAALETLAAPAGRDPSNHAIQCSSELPLPHGRLYDKNSL
jgi:hypothetical protein